MYTIYSKPACPQCEQAKALLESKAVNFSVVNLDVGQPREPGAAYITRDDLIRMVPTARTMPQIFNGDRYVGGFTELRSEIGA